jgi:hypothetical protein
MMGTFSDFMECEASRDLDFIQLFSEDCLEFAGEGGECYQYGFLRVRSLTQGQAAKSCRPHNISCIISVIISLTGKWYETTTTTTTIIITTATATAGADVQSSGRTSFFR